MEIFGLHERITAVCPIVGIDSDGKVDYAAEATQEQRGAAQAVVAAWPLVQARNAAVARVQAGYAAALAAGVTVGQIKLRAEAGDQAALANGLNVINAALLVGTPSSTLISVVFDRGVTDYDGQSHDMTLAQYAQMSLAYAKTIGAMQGTLATKTAHANAAETVEAANAINW